jgi:hypothetical protein
VLQWTAGKKLEHIFIHTYIQICTLVITFLHTMSIYCTYILCPYIHTYIHTYIHVSVVFVIFFTGGSRNFSWKHYRHFTVTLFLAHILYIHTYIHLLQVF